MTPTFRPFTIAAKSLNDLKAEYPNLIYSDWFKGEAFADVKAEPGTYHICFDYPNSKDKTWDKQQKLLKKGETVPSAAVVAQALIQHFNDTGERLLPSSWSRTSDTTSGGYRVYLGDFDADGLSVSGFWASFRLSDLGVSAVRNFQPLNLEARALEPSRPLDVPQFTADEVRKLKKLAKELK